MTLDNGVATTREFLVAGTLESGEPFPEARVDARHFGAMGWVAERWGAKAIVNAGHVTREYLREAIQRLSDRIRHRRVYTHTGWREVNGQWVYLTAGGAIGRRRVDVELGDELRRYRLPTEPEDPADAMRVSLRLLDVAPLSVTVPLWAAAFRAPLAAACPVDLAVWLVGKTGSLKSSQAALFLSHYGDFDRLHLPGSWKSTANQLELRAFRLKDALFVVDDYAPTVLDARDMAAKAARLIRAQGNLAGRGRLNSDLSEAPVYPPRGLIVATGEQLPPGDSILPRLFAVELERPFVNVAALTAAQAAAHRLPHALAGYLRWLGPQMPELPVALRQMFEEVRGLTASADAHLRVPEAVAHLWLGVAYGLAYAVEVGALTAVEEEAFRRRCWSALLAGAKDQGRGIDDHRSTRRFFDVLSTLLTQRRVCLVPKDTPGAGEDPRGVPMIGWQDAAALYLIPEAAYAAVAKFCHEAGDAFPISREQLHRELAAEGLTVCRQGRHTAVIRAGGGSQRVLWVRRDAAERLLGVPIAPATPGTAVTSVAAS